MSLSRKTPAAVVLLLCAALLSGTAQATSIEAQRKTFVAAERALKQGESQRYNRLKRQLSDYPLLPYLEYAELRGNLAVAHADAVQRFLTRYTDTPLAGRLRNAWLDVLAKKGRWREYADFFQPTKSAERHCNYLHALIVTGNRRNAFAQVKQLWLVGRSQPNECDPVFSAWRKAGHLTPELVWQRIQLAMNEGQIRLVSYLKRQLNASEQLWVDRWLRVHDKPELIRSHREFATGHPQRRTILLYGLKRMARENVTGAAAAWNTLKRRYRFDAEQLDNAERILAEGYLHHHHPDALAQLDQVEPGEDLRLHRKRILAALTAKDWKRVRSWIEELPTEERQAERWRYWKGRALQKLGHSGQAVELLTSVARDRTYYAFLAADRIGADYFLKHVPLQLDPVLLSRVGSMPVVQRSSELRALGRILDARREWWWLRQNLDAEELKAAAKIAKGWGWHAQAIFTLAGSGYWDDLELRFPVEHLELVEKYADSNELQIPWVLAVMRQESAFNAQAASHAGARGLMQLMPATARSVAKRLGTPRPNRRDLFQPEINIPLGTAYLSQVYDRLEQNPVLATAAYNAGPHRVERWLPQHTQEADVWVETIPFKETRNYVKRVMAYAVIYEKRLGQEPESIVARMRSIPGTLERAVTMHADAVRQDPSG